MKGFSEEGVVSCGFGDSVVHGDFLVGRVGEVGLAPGDGGDGGHYAEGFGVR